MFDISWGEIAVLGAVGVAVTGKRDLPMACRFVGLQIGRVVGLLQGARARADRFAHHNELKVLQNELRSGLRELDKVKTELAVAASTQGVMGKNLGAMTASANRTKLGGTTISGNNNNNNTAANPAWKPPQNFAESALQQPASPLFLPSATTGSSTMANDKNLSLSDFDISVEDDTQAETPTNRVEATLAPQAQSEKAVMEEEWLKQGIGFKAQAEQGSWLAESCDETVMDTTRATGSELLEHLERQCLIFDQYDRVVGEQEKEMEERVERIQNQRKQQNSSRENDKKEQ